MLGLRKIRSKNYLFKFILKKSRKCFIKSKVYMKLILCINMAVSRRNKYKHTNRIENYKIILNFLSI